MIVHFIASKSTIEENIASYRMITDTIESLGHSLALDWIEDAYDSINNGAFFTEDVDWGSVDRDNTAAISRADVVVVEATTKAFFVGYQVAQAVGLKKPILMLTRNGVLDDRKVPGVSSADGFVRSVTYDESNIKDVIEDFLKTNTIEVKDMRFNFFIDRKIYNYLRWASLKTGKTKAEILRELVEKEIDRQP